MEIIKIPIDELTADPDNAKDHPVWQIEQIKNSIEQFGNCDPIGVWGENNLVVEGNGRLEALKELGYTEAECIRLDWLTEEERRAYALAHNKLTMNSGFIPDALDLNLETIGNIDMSMFGFNTEQFDGEQTETPIDDEYIESAVPARTNKGDLYALGEHRLICGDSTSDDVERLMDGARADLFITDPPYGVDYASKNEFLNNIDKGNRIQTDIENDALTSAEEERDELWTPAFKRALKAAKDECSYYIFSPQGGELMMMMMAISNAGWQLKHTLVWVKNNIVLGRSDYNYQHEPVLYGWNKRHVFYGGNHASVIDDAKPEDLRKMKKDELLEWAINMQRSVIDDAKPDVLRFPKPLASELHPTMKPVPLIGYLIGNNTKQGDIVLDLFGGSGTTMIASEQMRRKCYMAEFDEHYCDVIIDRWEKFTGGKAVLLDDAG